MFPLLLLKDKTSLLNNVLRDFVQAKKLGTENRHTLGQTKSLLTQVPSVWVQELEDQPQSPYLPQCQL